MTCGATEAMAAALLAAIDPGDEVLIFAPFCENYGPDASLCGATPVWLSLDGTTPLDFDAVRAAITPRTRALIINSPNNPTGRVFTRAELAGLAAIGIERDRVAFTDEIYENVLSRTINELAFQSPSSTKNGAPRRVAFPVNLRGLMKP